MGFLEMLETMSALAGLAMILMLSAQAKKYLWGLYASL